MRRAGLIAILVLLWASITARAAAPLVVATVAPVHSLVAMVLGEAGSPVLLVPPGTSPHGFALRPSQARALDRAALVFWIGPGLENWLVGPLATLAGDARSVARADTPGLVVYARRAGGRWPGNGHEDGQGHEDADEQGHDHGSGGIGDRDMHMWLDPRNASLWVEVIAGELARLDPSNASLYAANAAAARAGLAALEDEIAGLLAPVRSVPYVVHHDAYRYFEERFGLHPVGSLALGDADAPSAARVRDIRARIVETGAHCVFVEPQFAPALVDTVIEGTGAAKGVLDPLGADLPAGAALYPALLRAMAGQLRACLG